MPRIYKTALGKTIDIESLKLQNETVIAVGNQRVNARGDEIDTAGKVVRTKDEQMAEHYRSKGFNIPSVWDKIAKDQGSVYGVEEHILSDEEKEVFRTFKEINQLEIVRQAGIRQQYVDQTVSLNLCFDPNDTPRWMSEVHKEAHKVGIKTLYYLRTESVLRGDNLDRTAACVACEG
jgi:ribonucleoside-diphosphate reductase alpha chain